MSSNVTQLDLSTFSASVSICIPRVFPNITKARGGDLSQPWFVSGAGGYGEEDQRKGEKYQRVFVGKQWNDDEQTARQADAPQRPAGQGRL